MTTHDPPIASKKPMTVVAWVSAGVALGSIWLSVLLAGVYSPDFVSGSQHEHLALVGGGDWIWGLVATAFVILALLDGVRRRVVNPTPWWGLALGVAAVWAVVLWVSVTAPVMVTGTDPTRIPLAAMGIPIVGVFMTWFVCTLAKTAFEQET
jgi:hypothetical protein